MQPNTWPRCLSVPPFLDRMSSAPPLVSPMLQVDMPLILDPSGPSASGSTFEPVENVLAETERFHNEKDIGRVAVA